MRALAAGCLIVVGGWVVIAAPAPKALPDEVTGAYSVYLDSPTVQVREPDGKFERYWLVCHSAADEFKARRFVEGDVIVVTGKLGRGGPYRYIVLGSVAKVD